MKSHNNRKTGMEKEYLAALYLQDRGFYITERNFHCRMGEIDLIGYDEEFLVFVEVKYRSSHKFADPLSAVNLNKIKQICKVADFYRYTRRIPLNVSVRYDVVGILNDEIVWIKNAFPHFYRS